MNGGALVQQKAAELVTRSRAGDQNATALLVRIGEEARKGGVQAMRAFQAAQQYIASNPAQEFQLGAETALVMDPPTAPSTALARYEAGAADPGDGTAITKAREKRKPRLPRGIFDRIFHPDFTAITIVRAAQYQNGIPAAAVVLAGGPPLTPPVIREFGASNFGSEESTGAFFHGVKNPGVSAWQKIAPHLAPPLRRCLVIGQCIGRARRIQQVRQPGSAIGDYSEVAGWELGES